MHAIQKQHIVDLFVWVDDSLPKQVQPGRPSVLRDSELLTMLIWDGLCEPHKNLSSVYDWIEREYRDCFPVLPRYQNFVAHVHRLLPQMVWLLQSLLACNAPLRFADSTMLPVCKPIRADRHKVACGVAQFGKNWQGWHYGFKLHAAIDQNNRLVALVFTPANEHDNQAMERLVDAREYWLVTVITVAVLCVNDFGNVTGQLLSHRRTIPRRKRSSPTGKFACYICGQKLKPHSASLRSNASWSLRSREASKDTSRTTCVYSLATRWG